MLNILIGITGVGIMYELVLRQNLKYLSPSEERELLKGDYYSKGILKKIGYQFKDNVCTGIEKLKLLDKVRVYHKNGKLLHEGTFKNYCFKNNSGYYVIYLPSEYDNYKFDKNDYVIKSF